MMRSLEPPFATHTMMPVSRSLAPPFATHTMTPASRSLAPPGLAGCANERERSLQQQDERIAQLRRQIEEAGARMREVDDDIARWIASLNRERWENMWESEPPRK